MSDKAIVWTDSQGGLNITYPVGDTVENVKKKSVPDGITSYIIDKAAVPTARSFRNAWTYTE